MRRGGSYRGGGYSMEIVSKSSRCDTGVRDRIEFVVRPNNEIRSSFLKRCDDTRSSQRHCTSFEHSV